MGDGGSRPVLLRPRPCPGLGLGLIVHALAADSNVTQITVIEREKDVIDLVTPLVPAVEDRTWRWGGGDSPTPDGVFFDLFVGNGRDLVPDALRAYVQMSQWLAWAHVRIRTASITISSHHLSLASSRR